MAIADDREAAFELYTEACSSPDGADWRAVADMLAGLLPKPKPRLVAGRDVLEWCEYTEAQHKGGARMFHSRIAAEFVFADLTRVVAPLRWRKSKDRPDWSRAARMAVRFYRAQYLAGVPDREAQDRPRLEVPAIILALDPTRNVCADPVKASEATADLRKGVSEAEHTPKPAAWPYAIAAE